VERGESKNESGISDSGFNAGGFADRSG
jgi:hypothetical protein